ncbi:MAG: dihydroorotate dehydrogenase-like protein [Odoribacter sp.]|nr:dihydroorotate dehydrogenase-like protein [Odoribacter sp.]
MLKSIFEEQILMDTEKAMGESNYPEQEDYIRTYVRAHTLQYYIELIQSAKANLSIPVIASINCVRDGEWVSFAKEIEKAGADALELNIFILPLDEFQESIDIEDVYFDIVKHVRKEVNIPLLVKISNYFTNLPSFVDKIKACGANGVTIFNRFYEPNIDIDRMAIGVASIFSSPTDLRTTLRWTGILAGKDSLLQISSSTGVHNGEAVVKMLLAGATTVQVCSELYQSGPSSICSMNAFLSSWMDEKGFTKIEQFQGNLSYANLENAARYERAQFMKYFSENKDSI